jgi:hypothetical protein
VSRIAGASAACLLLHQYRRDIPYLDFATPRRLNSKKDAVDRVASLENESKIVLTALRRHAKKVNVKRGERRPLTPGDFGRVCTSCTCVLASSSCGAVLWVSTIRYLTRR